MKPKSQHTPGPWKPVLLRKKTVGMFVYRDDGPGNNYALICRNIANESDARLIAQAPQMYESLKAFTEEYAFDRQGRAVVRVDSSVIDNARKILAKVEGA